MKAKLTGSLGKKYLAAKDSFGKRERGVSGCCEFSFVHLSAEAKESRQDRQG